MCGLGTRSLLTFLHTEDREWIEKNLLRLVEICKVVCAKYTRSKVRKALPENYAYIIDELLNCDSKNTNKENYYNAKTS